jgi:hypothetical protein
MERGMSSEGMAESHLTRPSLQDSALPDPGPSLKALDYLPSSLRDEAAQFLTAFAIVATSVGFGLMATAAPFDAAPFAFPLPEGNGLMWTDPREIHKVVVHFAGPAPAAESVRLEYWGSRWPEQHLPKDREPGGGSAGWFELGNWHTYQWRTADAKSSSAGDAITFTFQPVNAKEFPALKDYPAAFRWTLKLRVVSSNSLARILRTEAFTDSTTELRTVRLAWRGPPASDLRCEAFNGQVESLRQLPNSTLIRFLAVTNSDPNTFDRTLITIHNGAQVFTFKADDLAQGPLFLPEFGADILPENDPRGYADIETAIQQAGGRTLYDRVAALPEQTWKAAWDGMPPKKSRIYFPLGLDGGRQRFRLDADGTVRFRSNDHYLTRRPGRDTPRFALEAAPVRFRFQPPIEPVDRTIEEQSLPICITTWETNGIRLEQTAFATPLEGARAGGPVPAADASTVFLARFTLSNTTDTVQSFFLPLSFKTGDALRALRADDRGFLWNGANLRGQFVGEVRPEAGKEELVWRWTLAPGQSSMIVFKLPYVVLCGKTESDALAALDFDREHRETAGYWRRRLDESSRLITPEPMLNEFYRAHAGHLLINCELDPEGNARRFARVGSFAYGAYGNESCMMVVDLDRRGYHKEAAECLEAWLHYQGTAKLPGDFSTQEGVLYGAGGVEEGGYNQHHGWILWMLGEHYRFTRDEAWLRQAAPGIVKGADWIINETRRTAERREPERGLLPSGQLEDIGDWWPWLSTSCYMWRGLDSAAWALEQIRHPDAGRIRAAANAYRTSLLSNFRKASERSPVVRLRNGEAVPHVPSMVYRRGRYFGWICETLEGSIHLLITRALDPCSKPAGWILNDYEDNRYLSNQYGYTLDDFERHWFGRGGMSMQACLLLDAEPYLYRDDVKHALRAIFNALAVSYFPDVRMNTEHALPAMGDYAGDHYKSSDESNAAGWLRYLFVREEGETLLLGQAVPREWLKPGKRCGIERASTWFGKVTLLYEGRQDEIQARLSGPARNPPQQIRLRFRDPQERPLVSVTVNGKPWKKFQGEWVELPRSSRETQVVATFR